jgi:hypothetical protein
MGLQLTTFPSSPEISLPMVSPKDSSLCFLDVLGYVYIDIFPSPPSKCAGVVLFSESGIFIFKKSITGHFNQRPVVKRQQNKFLL